MINREWQTVKVNTFTSGVDDYGQIRQKGKTYNSEQMVIKPFSQSNINNPLYINVTLTALTKNRSITTENTVEIENIEYNILYIIPSKNYSLLLLSKS